MAGRNRGPSNPLKSDPTRGGGGGPQLHDPPPFPRGFLPHHPALLEELREREAAEFARAGAGGPRGIPPHAILEEKLAIQHQEIQGLLVDNQRLAATHVALKQNLESAQHELHQMVQMARAMQAAKDGQIREVYERSLKMEADLRAAEGMKGELVQVRGDIQKLSASRLELSNQVQGLTQDLTKANLDLQQAPLLKQEIESMKNVLQRARAAIEYEKKGYAENYEQGQQMENNLVSMARELEKLRAEVSNAEKRAQAAAAVGNATGPGYGGNASEGYGGNAGAGYGANTGAGYGANAGGGYGGNTGAGYGGNAGAGYGGNTSAGYGGNYNNPNTGYGGNPYPAAYGMNPAQGGADGSTQYGPGAGAWGGGYDTQRPNARR